MRDASRHTLTPGGSTAPLGACTGSTWLRASSRLALLVTGALAAAAFGLLAAIYDQGIVARADVRLERWRRDLPEWAHGAGHALDWLGGHWWLPPVVLAAFGALVVSRRVGAAVFLVAASGGADAFLHLVKLGVDRDRAGEGSTLPPTAAFPSGHATTALTIYVALALLFGTRAFGRPRLVLVASAAVFAVAVGAGRFVDGVKTASDVAGGVLLGVVWLVLLVWLCDRLRQGRAPS